MSDGEQLVLTHQVRCDGVWGEARVYHPLGGDTITIELIQRDSRASFDLLRSEAALLARMIAEFSKPCPEVRFSHTFSTTAYPPRSGDYARPLQVKIRCHYRPAGFVTLRVWLPLSSMEVHLLTDQSTDFATHVMGLVDDEIPSPFIPLEY